MTANQINFWRLQEDKRHNLVGEGETQRHNKATEFETYRHNVSDEGIRSRDVAEKERHNLVNEYITTAHNVAMEDETHRSNVAREQETQRHNYATETEERYKNDLYRSKIQIDAWNYAAQDDNRDHQVVQGYLDTVIKAVRGLS